MPGKSAAQSDPPGAKTRTVAIGWDAATWDLLQPWVVEGRLPNLAGLLSRGCQATLNSTSVPVSPAAWTTIITGQNPARHGIFDWFQRQPDSYEVQYVHTGQIAAQPIWRYFDQAGLRIGLANVPMLYPAVETNGFLLSGMAAPGSQAKDFSYPAALIREIEAELGTYRMDEGSIFRTGQEMPYLEGMLQWIDYQAQVVKYLLKRHPCQAYLFVFMQSDHVQHKFWRYQDSSFPGYDEQRDGPYRDAVYRVFAALDEVLGELLAVLDDNTNLVLLSDHGAGPCQGVMYVNQWLQQQGWLRLKSAPAVAIKRWLARHDVIQRGYRFLARLGLSKIALMVSKPARDRLMGSGFTFQDIDWRQTVAYSHGAFGQIFINLKGREPGGIVEPGPEYEANVERIMDGLRQLEHPVTGQKLITDLHRRHEVFEGPFLDRAADILFTIRDYRYVPSKRLGLGEGSLLGPSEYEDSGSHRPQGILVMAGPDIQPSSNHFEASVADITPTILALCDLPVPRDLDGRPLLEMLTDAKRSQVQWAESSEAQAKATQAPELDAEEIEELESRLRDLGYLE